MTRDTAAIYRELTSPAGPFPVVETVLDGRPTRIFDCGPRTLAETFLVTRGHDGGRDALVYLDERYTYCDQWRIVMAAARALRDRYGIVAGDRVALAMRNFPEWAFTFWAAQLLGAVVVPLNAWLTGSELVTVLADSAPLVLVADADRVERLAQTPQALGALRGVVVVRGEHPAALPWNEFIGGLDGTDVDPHAGAPDDVATILYTSGTTGVPKGVVGTHRNHTTTILTMRLRAEAVRRARLADVESAGAAQSIEQPRQGVTLLTNPLFHIAALTTLESNAYAGRRVVLMYKWDVTEAMRLIGAEGVSELSGPPMIVRQVVDAAASGGHDTSSLVSLVSGAAPAPPRLIADVWATFDGHVSPGTGYGSTETTSAVLTITGADFVAHPNSVGRPLPTVEIRVRDEHGEPVPVGQVGELQIRGPQVAPGYHERPDATVAAYSNGWYRTGDEVRVDAHGYVYLVGRLKDVIIRAGENVYCAEVEAALESHPEVLEAAVVGRPHAVLGEDVAAVVRLRPNHDADPAALASYLSDRLAAFKVPAWMRLTDEPLPRTPSGKVVKSDLSVVDMEAVRR